MAIVGYDWRENVNNLNVCVHTHMSTTGCIHYQSRMCIANYIVFTVTPQLSAQASTQFLGMISFTINFIK